MKTHTPYTRNELNIRRSDRVVEVGSGHNPTYRADVIVEKFIDNNYHRLSGVKIYPHQKFVNADGEHLPFSDDEFDYIICCHVLEHADDPVQFLKEQSRVAKRGYIETPSFLGEFLHPKQSHKWVILEIDGKLVLFEKEKMPAYEHDYGTVFLNYIPYQSLAYKILQIVEPQFSANRYEWKDGIDFIVNPTDEYYRSFFTKPWTVEMTKKIFPPRSVIKEIYKLCVGIWHIVKGEFCKFSNKEPMTIEDYKKTFGAG